MSVICTNSDCPEYQIEKSTDNIEPGAEVICGWCANLCAWPDDPPAEDDPPTDPDAE